MVRLKCRRKAADVQSILFGAMIFSTGVGIDTGVLEVQGFDCRNSLARFLESASAAPFNAPGIWETATLTLK